MSAEQDLHNVGPEGRQEPLEGYEAVVTQLYLYEKTSSPRM